MDLPKNLDRMKVGELGELTRAVLAKNKGKDEEIKNMAFSLIKEGGWGKSCLASDLLRGVGKIVSREEFKGVVWQMADDSNWAARECAAMLLGRLLLSDFDYYFSEMKKMVKDKNPNIRRVAVVGSMVGGLNEGQSREVAEFVYGPLMVDDDIYVRKNLGPFAVSQLLRRYPKMAIKYFDQWIAGFKPRVVWNILNAFQPARLKENRWGSRVKEAKKYLAMVENLEDKTIQGAVKSLQRRINSL
jgi:hypothetical protein